MLGEKWPGARGVERAAHWYLAALHSQNPWNRFQWAFFALEVLIHKLAPRLYSQVRESFRFDRCDGEPIPGPSLGPMLPPLEALTIAPRFTVVALGLSPSTAERDISAFVQIKKARDDLAHGQITDAAELPEATALDLVRRYLHLALESH